MVDPVSTVYVIDDDEQVRDGLLRLLRSAGIGAVAFASAPAFLEAMPSDGHGCILLDVGMPGMTGPELHEHLAARRVTYPVIYLTGNGTVSGGVEAMKRGAVDFLEKPIDDEALLAAIDVAMTRHARTSADRDRNEDIKRRLTELSAREYEVLQHVIRGRLNKQIAADLGISLKTVKVHRGRVMAKMEVRSVAELVRLFDGNGVVPAADA
jgi:FixJ family two-component response regulator